MVLLDKGALRDVWTDLKTAAAANPDVPTVLLLVAQDVDGLAAYTMITARAPAATPAHVPGRTPHLSAIRR